ncbi:hypothetical protein L1987_09005 [Smallanthus sonchifolius]|uniref:Uncharacterized protein n=1 Tax=Smallanthus sonchifolius TaxID=185202 RepID=A0ACB9JM66_9ASTR|nr:hypothetical protein L1987_09005 [Smallanthus sonchifolius]
METDDWGFSAEELDFLEKDALNRIAQRNTSAGGTSTSTSAHAPSKFYNGAHSHFTPSAKPIYESNFHNKSYSIRDIRPQNSVLIDQSSGQIAVEVHDFGPTFLRDSDTSIRIGKGTDPEKVVDR